MWFISIPDWVYHLILGIGIISTLAGFTLGMIPIIKKYALPLQIIGVIVLVSGVYFEGKLATEKEFEQKISDLKVKLAQAEAKSERVNTKIVTKIITQKEVIKEKGDSTIEYVDREIVKYDDKCFIPEQVIIAHNAAAQNKKIDEILTNNSVLKTDDHNRAAMPPDKMILPKK